MPSKYTFIDGYGNEQPMPPEQDNDEAQYRRGEVAGEYYADNNMAPDNDNPSRWDSNEHASLKHDLKRDVFRRGYLDGYMHVRRANGAAGSDEEETECRETMAKLLEEGKVVI